MLKAISDFKWPTSKTGQTIVTYLTFTVALFSISPGGKTPWHGEAPNAAQWLLPAREPIKVWLWLQVTCSRYNSVPVQLWHVWVFFSDVYNIFGLIFDLVVFLSDLWFGTHPPQRYSGRSEEWACDQQLFEDLFRSLPHHLHSHHFHHNHHHLQIIICITIMVTIIIDVTTIPLTITLGSVLKAECEGELGLVFKEFICKRVPPGNKWMNGGR